MIDVTVPLIAFKALDQKRIHAVLNALGTSPNYDHQTDPDAFKSVRITCRVSQVGAIAGEFQLASLAAERRGQQKLAVACDDAMETLLRARDAHPMVKPGGE